jgi:aspartyl/asparaginyl beta-hydroxylase (cupin superfamily)
MNNQFFYDSKSWKYADTIIQSYDGLLNDFNQMPQSSWTSSGSGYNNTLINSTKWHFIPFITKGIRHESNINRCLTVKALLDTVPIYDNCLFSIIDGGGIVPPHQGFSDHHLRVHLGITTDGLAWIRVGDQIRHWQERQLLIFHDWDNHEVQNPSNNSRVVFLFDIEKQCYVDNCI